MGKTAWNIVAAAEVVLACAAVAVGVFMGGCSMQVETAAGGMVPMKCHWTLLATDMIAVIAALAGVLALVSKDAAAKRMLCIMACVSFAVLLAALNVVMGVCNGEMSECRTTQLYLNIVSVLGLVASAVAAGGASGRELPKAKL